MSRAIASRQDSDDDDGEWSDSASVPSLPDDDDGEWSNSASVPSLPVSRRRSLPRSSKRLRDKGESFNENGPRKKTATDSAADLKGLHATEKDVGSEDAQVLDHRESHEGVTTAAAASQPMNSDSSQTSQNDGSANKYSQKLSTSHPPPNAAGRYSAWEDRLSELADYRKIYGHCNVPRNHSENSKLANWVKKQRSNYSLHQAGKASHMTLSRIQELESLGFEWTVCVIAWEDRLSELANYRKIHGHCNVPQNCSENTKLGKWVGTQRNNYRLHREGKKSQMTTIRIQELESLGFEWKPSRVGITAWEDRLSELANYRKVHGHCNVPQNYIENSKLANWVANLRCQYRLDLTGEGKSYLTLSRIQTLESMGFKWKFSISWLKGTLKKPSLDGCARRASERAVEVAEHVQTSVETQEDVSAREIRRSQIEIALEPEESHRNDEVHLAYISGRTEEI
jgi:hypothetical protein